MILGRWSGWFLFSFLYFMYFSKFPISANANIDFNFRGKKKLYFFFLFLAMPAACRSSQAMDWTQATSVTQATAVTQAIAVTAPDPLPAEPPGNTKKLFFFLFRAIPGAYGGSQARGWMELQLPV